MVLLGYRCRICVEEPQALFEAVFMMRCMQSCQRWDSPSEACFLYIPRRLSNYQAPRLDAHTDDPFQVFWNAGSVENFMPWLLAKSLLGCWRSCLLLSRFVRLLVLFLPDLLSDVACLVASLLVSCLLSCLYACSFAPLRASCPCLPAYLIASLSARIQTELEERTIAKAV